MDAEFHILQFLRQEHTTLIKQAHVIAEVLEFPQIMRGDHRCEVPVDHFLRHKALHRLADHRIKAVKNLVAEQVPCAGTQPQQHGGFLAHAAGKGPDRPAQIQPHGLHHLPETLLIEILVEQLKTVCAFRRCRIQRKIPGIRKKTDIRLQRRVLSRYPASPAGYPEKLPAVIPDITAVRPDHAGHDPHQRAFPRAVSTDQAENPAVIYPHRNATESFRSAVII